MKSCRYIVNICHNSVVKISNYMTICGAEVLLRKFFGEGESL